MLSWLRQQDCACMRTLEVVGAGRAFGFFFHVIRYRKVSRQQKFGACVLDNRGSIGAGLACLGGAV